MKASLVTVGLYQTPEEAHVALLPLERERLTVFVEDENYQLTENPGWPADGVKVRVPADQAERARTLLGDSAWSPPA